MLFGLLLFEILSVGLFAWFVTGQQTREVYARIRRRTGYQAESLADQAQQALIRNQPAAISFLVQKLSNSPTVNTAKVTDPAGNILFGRRGSGAAARLNPLEQSQLSQTPQNAPRCFAGVGVAECVRAIYTGANLRGFAWVESNRQWDYEELNSIQLATIAFGLIWIAASLLLVLAMSRSILEPLSVLHRGARALLQTPEDRGAFPLPVTVNNEIGDLIRTFNSMATSLAMQQEGLTDTLSLLNSTLANAPIGMAFLDRNAHVVRMNQVFADLTGAPLHSNIGRVLPELLPQPLAHQLEEAVLRVFSRGEPVYDLEFSGHDASGGKSVLAWTWLVSAYPVRTVPGEVRWAGIILIDASERKRSEEALRRSEKLSVTGRLAASIAHEINNPLEAVTNLVFLLRNFSTVDAQAQRYIEMLEYEVRRISEITQQTLRFYRQSTQPARVTLGDLLDSVLSLYHGRVEALDIRLERRYDPRLTLFCFDAEIRQVVANLVANAIDALAAAGGRLIVRAQPSRNWRNRQKGGIRFVVADSGSGIPAVVREHIFEPFFTTKDATGTGLGLWVTQEIVRKHRGLIQVRSRSADEGERSHKRSGTVFQVFIPDDPELAAQSLQASAP